MVLGQAEPSLWASVPSHPECLGEHCLGEAVRWQGHWEHLGLGRALCLSGNPAPGTEPGLEAPWILAKLVRKGKHFEEVYKTVCGKVMSRDGQCHSRGHPVHQDQVPRLSQHPGPSEVPLRFGRG